MFPLIHGRRPKSTATDSFFAFIREGEVALLGTKRWDRRSREALIEYKTPFRDAQAAGLYLVSSSVRMLLRQSQRIMKPITKYYHKIPNIRCQEKFLSSSRWPASGMSEVKRGIYEIQGGYSITSCHVWIASLLIYSVTIHFRLSMIHKIFNICTLDGWKAPDLS